MKILSSEFIIILGVTLTSRFTSVVSFSASSSNSRRAPAVVVTRMSEAIARHNANSNGLTTRTSSTVLRGKTNDSSSSSNDKQRNKNKNNNNNTNKKSTVAIIGGGIAGLSCARHLQHSYDVTVVSSVQLVHIQHSTDPTNVGSIMFRHVMSRHTMPCHAVSFFENNY